MDFTFSTARKELVIMQDSSAFQYLAIDQIHEATTLETAPRKHRLAVYGLPLSISLDFESSLGLQSTHLNVQSGCTTPVRQAAMRNCELHLISDSGEAVGPQIAAAVEAAYRWAVSMFPSVDTALLANAAERLAKSMEANKELVSPRRYAYAAMHGKVRDLRRTKAGSEASMSLHEMERLGVPAKTFEDDIERSILFHQLRAKLSARDRFILILLTECDAGPKKVANALGVSTEAATKAIQRVRQRLAACLDAAEKSSKERRSELSISKGLTKEWI
jgi:RNA polymerase sigma factor (sigma-70 family)